MNFSELLQIADAAMEARLTSAGFRRMHPGCWSRCRGEELSVVQLQAHSAEKSFCVNLGVHFTFLPKAGVEALLDLNQLELVDCEVRIRLTDSSTSKDQWWKIAFSSVDQIADLICGRGLAIFDLYRLDGAIAALDGSSIEHGNAEILASMTKVRACLLLARIHERLGNRDKCIETATVGIRLAGMAVGPKKALKDILKRVEHSV